MLGGKGRNKEGGRRDTMIGENRNGSNKGRKKDSLAS
jgi:hypothetical protein